MKSYIYFKKIMINTKIKNNNKWHTKRTISRVSSFRHCLELSLLDNLKPHFPSTKNPINLVQRKSYEKDDMEGSSDS